MTRTVLFDLDGTLVDTEKVTIQSCQSSTSFKAVP